MKKEELRHFWELLWGMTEKELRVRYKNTVFGLLWILVNPLLQMLVISYIFPFFITVPIPNYSYNLLIGLLVWNFFSFSMAKTTPSIVNERALITKTRFPYITIPLSIIASHLIHFFIALLVIIIPAAFNGLLVPWRSIYFLEATILLVMTTCGLGLLTSSLNVRYRDITFIVQALLIVWFYATPIIYTLSFIPKGAQWLWHMNPFTVVIFLFQFALIGATPIPTSIIITNTSLIIIITIIGFLTFAAHEKHFSDFV